MKFIITLLLLMIMSVSCIEDEDAVNNSGWEKEWGSDRTDSLNAIAASPDDMIYVGGMTLGELYAPKVGIDATLAAFNPKGDELWGKQWSVNDDENDVWGLVVDDEGNIYAGGGGHNPFMTKFSPDGTKIWEKFPEIDSIICLALDKSGNVYAGTSYGDILKYSPEGKELWRHNISTEDAEGQIQALAVDSEGNIYAGGTTWDSLFGENAGETDAFLVKIAPDKTHVWEKQWGGGGHDIVNGLAIDDSDNLYVAGSSYGEAEVLAKYSADGVRIWGQTGKNIHYLSVVIDNGNNVYFGSGGYNDRIHKYSSDGKKIWSSKDAGETEWGAAGIALDSYGNLYVCGGSEENHLMKIPASEME